MAASFEHTLRSLQRSHNYGFWLLVGLPLIGAWTAWLRLGSIPIYVSARQARVEVSNMPSRVATVMGGRVVALDLRLGQTVQREQVLLEVDDSVQRAQLSQQTARLDVLAASRRGVEVQLAAEQERRRARLRLADVVAQRAALSLARARAGVSHQTRLTQISESLQLERLNSRVDAIQAQEALQMSQIAVADAVAGVDKLAAEHDYEDKSELARIAELQRRAASLEAETREVDSAVRTAEAQLLRLQVRAPATGRIGDMGLVRVGDVIEPGQVVATIVPTEEIRVVAHFPQEGAVGRILPGQPARVKLDGFSWLEYGAVDATVAFAASEAHAGLVRVELALGTNERSRIPLQHGLTGSVDVRTDEVSPWVLLQRSVGKRVDAPIESVSSQSEPRLAGEVR